LGRQDLRGDRAASREFCLRKSREDFIDMISVRWRLLDPTFDVIDRHADCRSVRFRPLARANRGSHLPDQKQCARMSREISAAESFVFVLRHFGRRQ